MTTFQSIYARLVTAYTRMTQDTERGDVPGWVLITMMTAGLVTALWAVAGPTLNGLFTSAVNGVQGP
ncbi:MULTISPECIES: hypothetical protein [Kytococcus]|uniref:Uncharacterized protein n=1 Tax=Kytococcus schroeteri TaxID=138300 RepID=A0A2I1PBE6_9MICO|nr:MULTISPECIES: hypothetical protein [Kytococcus]OFS14804.1 hypothetical protein HMPREF3099_03355 [Kytococcus sp. HMSC28H12]PKZ41948.1 hypothetical protein CYJ76_04630 [Kytococcus schroeteri]